MARRKKGTVINGWIVLDKPLGLTSTQALSAVKRLFDAQKAGHAGTLDPLATGILPLAFGEATKTVPFAFDGKKAYRFKVQWGTETTTDDAEGSVINTSDARPTNTEIDALIPRFVGEIMQVPPQFSAIKIDGQRAYDLARGGEQVQIEARPVIIDRLEMVERESADSAVFEAECGKGTYVRSIARDMGRILGCFGHVIELRRTRVGPFYEVNAVTLETLQSAGENLHQYLKPCEAALADVPELIVTPPDALDLLQGRAILIRGRDAPLLSGPMYATCRGRIVALGEIHKGALHPTRVFNLG
jgi:tRNA pseudouridine55 synthase